MPFKMYKPKFWDYEKLSLESIILLPFVLMYIFFFYLKKILTKTQIHSIKTICIGNIYLGGTGKTPLSIKIAKKLNDKFKVVIIKKMRSKHIDEIKLIEKNFENIITAKNRNSAIRTAIKNNFNLAILDDGLQDFSFKKNVKIICFDGKNGLGNMMQIPSGPLRESYKKTSEADFVIINGQKNKKLEKNLNKINFPENNIFYSNYKFELKYFEKFKQNNIVAFAGIANPENFFNLLVDNGFKIQKKIVFPDHYNFNPLDIEKIKNIAKTHNLKILTTEKDFYRIGMQFRKEIGYIPVNLSISNENIFFDKLEKKLNENI